MKRVFDNVKVNKIFIAKHTITEHLFVQLSHVSSSY